MNTKHSIINTTSCNTDTKPVDHPWHRYKTCTLKWRKSSSNLQGPLILMVLQRLIRNKSWLTYKFNIFYVYFLYLRIEIRKISLSYNYDKSRKFNKHSTREPYVVNTAFNPKEARGSISPHPTSTPHPCGLSKLCFLEKEWNLDFLWLLISS